MVGSRVLAGLTLRPASHLGAHVHIGGSPPRAVRFLSPVMTLPPNEGDRRKLNQPGRYPREPYGGLWTLATPFPPREFVTELSRSSGQRMIPAAVRAGWKWYQLAPAAGVELLIIDSPAVVAALLERWPATARPFGVDEIDYGKMAAAGIVGVHALADAAARWKPALPLWAPGATLWLTWCFRGGPVVLPLLKGKELAHARRTRAARGI